MKKYILPPMLWYYENGCLYKWLKSQNVYIGADWIEYIPAPTWDFTVLPPLTLPDTPNP